MTNDEAVAYIIRHCNPDYSKGKTEWETAINMAIDALRNSPTQMSGTSDAVSRRMVLDALHEYMDDPDYTVGYLHDVICNLPYAQPEQHEITDEQAIEHLQSTGWMQNHDREMYESGIRECLSDDRGSYDSLIPETHECDYEELDFVQKHKRIPVTLVVQTHGDVISRAEAINALKGLPTWWADAGGYYGDAQPPMTALLDPEDAISAIENLPSVQAEQKKGHWIPVDDPSITGRCSVCGFESILCEDDVYGYDYCPNCGARLEMVDE